MSYSIKTDQEHIYEFEMWTGSRTCETFTEHIYNNEKIALTEVSYPPALVKIINEVIDNSCDALINKKKGKIEVFIDKKKVKVQDNGDGIPVKTIQDLDGKEILIPEACWGRAKAGGSFDKDKSTKVTQGTHGVGSFATNVLSNYFIGITCDGINEYIGKWSKNSLQYIEEVNPKKTKGTTVEFEPDMSIYSGIEEITEDIVKVIKTRLVNLSLIFENISFYLNNEHITFNKKSLLNSLTDKQYSLIETDNFYIAVMQNEKDDFNCYTVMNGLSMRYGTHIDYILKYVIKTIKEKLPKKYNDISYGEIKNKLQILFIGKNFPNIKFESQTKETLKNPDKDISAYLGDSLKALTENVSKNKELIKHITFLYDVKLEVQAKKALKDLDKKQPKNIRNEKFMKPIGDYIDIFLAEGDSASTSISKILGRENKGYFAMFGVPPNVYDIQIKDISGSKKLIELKEILNLSFSTTTQNDISFKNIVIATDFDLPGHFICGQLIGLFYRFGKNLFEEKRIKRFITPLVIVYKNDKIINWFYSFNDYLEFESKNKDKKYKYEYKKGLGSWDKEELEYIIEKDGFENMLEVFVLDENSQLNIHNWLSSNTADERKAMLEGFSFNIMEL